MTTLPSSYTDCLEIWEPQPPGNFRACSDLYRGCITLTLLVHSAGCYYVTRHYECRFGLLFVSLCSK